MNGVSRIPIVPERPQQALGFGEVPDATLLPVDEVGLGCFAVQILRNSSGWILKKGIGSSGRTRTYNLRLTAVRCVPPPAAMDCYKILSLCNLACTPSAAIAIHTAPIMTDFEGGWAQKWAQSRASDAMSILTSAPPCAFPVGGTRRAVLDSRLRFRFQYPASSEVQIAC